MVCTTTHTHIQMLPNQKLKRILEHQTHIFHLIKVCRLNLDHLNPEISLELLHFRPGLLVRDEENSDTFPAESTGSTCEDAAGGVVVND